MRRIDIKGVIVSNDVQWIYDLFDIESTSPKNVLQKLEEANGDDLEVVINSGGGEVPAGSEIYTDLKSYSGKVTTKIVGIAASAASVIAMAGDKTLISPTAQLMIHNVSTIARGDYRDLQHGSDFLKNYNKSIANAYMLKSGMSQEELLQLMDEETWFNAQQALDKNLVDEIMFSAGQTNLAANAGDSQLLPQKVIDTIRNEFQASKKTEGQTNRTEEDDEPMNLEDLKNKHPELYEQVKNDGHAEGVKAENARIKAIEDLGVPGNDDLINKAKFETNETAEQVAVNIIRAQKELGNQYLTNSQKDAQELGGIKGSEAPENNSSDDKERDDKASTIANFINKKRGGTK